MHSIKALEKQWRDYRTKKIIQRMIKMTLLYIGGGVLYLLYFYSPSIKPFFANFLKDKKTEFSHIVEKESEKNITLVVNNEVLVEKNNKLNDENKTNEKYEVVLEPIIPIVTESHISHKSHSHSSKKKYSRKTHKIRKTKRSTYLTKKELAVLNHSAFESDSRKIKKINLHSTSNGYIQTMKAKFQRSKKPREALLLAKAFYKASNFKEAERWALIANKLNSNLDESWFIFAKAKAKLGKKKEAIKILATYYKKSHSPKARALIYDIKQKRI